MIIFRIPLHTYILADEEEQCVILFLILKALTILHSLGYIIYITCGTPRSTYKCMNVYTVRTQQQGDMQLLVEDSLSSSHTQPTYILIHTSDSVHLKNIY